MEPITLLSTPLSVAYISVVTLLFLASCLPPPKKKEPFTVRDMQFMLGMVIVFSYSTYRFTAWIIE